MSNTYTILAVDDQPLNLEIIEEILDEEFKLKFATSGQEAIEIIEHDAPDMVLLDIMMPGIDGYETCKQIKKMRGIVTPKIILISGKAMVDERLKGYDVGADDYLTKPFHDDEFLAKVRVFTRLIAAERELRKLNDSLAEQVDLRTEQLLQSKQMAFLGMHVAEITHNLKSPLTIISAGVSRLQKGDLASNKDLQRIGRGCDKLTNIVRTILTSGSNKKTNAIQKVDLNDVLRNEIDLLHSNTFFATEVEKDIDLKTIGMIEGDASHFSQIFGNLIGNAIDALHTIDNPKISVVSKEQDGKIIVTISDSGTGISPENLENIFDPFFTTKPSASEDGSPTGTGLGLPSVKKMVEAYGGDIDLRSILGSGTTFTISIPIVQ